MAIAFALLAVMTATARADSRAPRSVSAVASGAPPAGAADVRSSRYDRRIAEAAAKRGHRGKQRRGCKGHKRRCVPRSFMGVTYELDPDGQFDQAAKNVRMMARNGVESVRISLAWLTIQPVPDGPYDWSRFDGLIRLAVAHGLTVLPVLESAPQWARQNPEAGVGGEPKVADYVRFARAAVRHYGPGSSFARETGHALRFWQIWNEPNGSTYWNKGYSKSGRGEPIPGGLRDYGKLLRAARHAIKRLDHGAKIVLGGLLPLSYHHGVLGSSIALDKLYKLGYGRDFDIVDIHPYTLKLSNLMLIVRQLRQHLNRHRGGRQKRIWLTEVTWPSALGHGSIPKQMRFGFEVTDHGQARKLRQAYMRFAAERRSLGIGRIYWYTWDTPDTLHASHRSTTTFNFAGLIRVRGSDYHVKPALHAFRDTARKLEGCAKTANARRCKKG